MPTSVIAIAGLVERQRCMHFLASHRNLSLRNPRRDYASRSGKAHPNYSPVKISLARSAAMFPNSTQKNARGRPHHSSSKQDTRSPGDKNTENEGGEHFPRNSRGLRL